MLPSSVKIMNRENSEDMLRLLFASRVLYNQSEILIYISWLLCILMASLLFFPQGYFVVVLYIILGVAIWILTKVTKEKCKKAGEIRNYFDKIVLFNKNVLELSFDLKETAVKIVEKNKPKYEETIQTNGHDKPPGVRDWYEFSKELMPIKAQYSCQHQNFWWNKKMIVAKVVMGVIIFVLLLGLFAVLIVLLGFNPIFIAVFGCIFLSKLIDEIYNDIKYYRIMIQLDGFFELSGDSVTEKELERIQSLIEQKRIMPVVQLSIYHRIKARKFSDLYLKI